MKLEVSLVVPVRDESKTLYALWESVRRQTFAPAEIVIVDGGSIDGTVRLARELAELDGRIRVIEAGAATPGRGRNVGISAATHDWIALTDAGVRLEPGWLEALVRVAEADPSLRMVQGHYEPVVNTFFDRCAALAYVNEPVATPDGEPCRVGILSVLIHRDAWESAGHFPDLRSGEDIIFMDRIRSSGVATGWAPAAVAHWEMRPNLVQTFRRFRLFSSNAVRSGLVDDWHKPVARTYLVALAFLLLARRRGKAWALIPLMGGAARVERRIWRNRDARPVSWALNPAQFVGVAVVATAIDAATLVGWADTLLERLLRRRRSTAPQ